MYTFEKHCRPLCCKEDSEGLSSQPGESFLSPSFDKGRSAGGPPLSRCSSAPGLDELGERAIVGLLDFGREAAAGELFVGEVIAETLAASAVARTACVGALAVISLLVRALSLRHQSLLWDVVGVYAKE
jgi:hypothetical protein